MAVTKHETLAIRTESDVVQVRQAVRQWASELGFSLVDQTKIVTAASELARNALVHGRGGSLEWRVVSENGKQGLQLMVTDTGPGIKDITLAMKDGWSTGSGLGMGLPGAKRLVNEFKIDSKPGAGTTVTVIRWK